MQTNPDRTKADPLRLFAAVVCAVFMVALTGLIICLVVMLWLVLAIVCVVAYAKPTIGGVTFIPLCLAFAAWMTFSFRRMPFDLWEIAREMWADAGRPRG